MDKKLSSPLSTLQWVDRDMVKPNDYNPNKVSKQNLELLKQSILTNGWTLPIVVRLDFTIIDGFHRWTVAGEEPLKSMLEGKVPVVIVEHASEVRKRLAENGEFTVNDILDDKDDWEAMVDDAPVNANESAETSNTALSAETKAPKEQEETETDSATDTTIPTGCGVIVVKDGKVLVGTRKDNGLVCGPGGHIEIGETPEDAAIRETREEFGINIANIIPVTLISGMSEQYCPSQVFLCTEYYGNPICFNTEMEDARFEDIGSVLDMDLFLPFRLSLEDFLRQLDEIRLTAEVSQSNMEADGGPGSGRYPKGSGKKNEKSGSKKKKSQSLPMTAKEKAKVTHDINNVYHAKYKGKSSCYIRTHSNEPDSPAYVYRFRNHGFDDYEIYMKESTD